MKNVNILSIIEAYRKLSNTLFQKLMNSYGIISGIKDYELNGIESFVNELLKIKNSITIVNNYYLGYSIPQIGKEFDLLLFLASNKGRVFTKKQIYSQVWEEEYAFDDSNIMSFISKLRKKIEPDPDHPFYILTVRGVGYRFNKEA